MIAITKNSYLKIVKASAWYDLVITAVFATPWTFTLFYHILQSAANALNIPGAAPALNATDVLFANLLGTVVIIWSFVRLRSPTVTYGRYDAFGRLFFVLWQTYAVFSGASYILLGFTFFEILFGILQALPLKSSNNKNV